MGVNEGETGVNPVLDTNMAGFENGQLDWKFVTPEAYNVYKAKKKLQEQLDAADVQVSIKLPIMRHSIIERMLQRKK